MQDIHEIRPPVPVGMDPIFIYGLMIAAALLLLVLAGWIFWRWWKKRSGKEAVPETEAMPEPFDEATMHLDALVGKNPSDIRVFYFELTGILRRYIGRSFQVNAAEMTSEEFARSLNHLPMEKDIRKKILGFQEFSDPIKYAARIPEPQRPGLDISDIRSLIGRIEQQIRHQTDQETGRHTNQYTDQQAGQQTHPDTVQTGEA